MWKKTLMVHPGFKLFMMSWVIIFSLLLGVMRIEVPQKHWTLAISPHMCEAL